MPIIEIAALHKRYGATIAVDDISLSVEQGEIFGILGPNGAGKTTTVECLAGLRRPDRGTMRVAGFDPTTERAQIRQLVGVQLQEARLPDQLRVGEAIELYASFYPDPADTDALLDDYGLGHARATAFQDLSGGQQQRLSIAIALVGNPHIAVLDELTTGLDPHARRETWNLIEQVRDAGVTVVLVSHIMEEAERLCDRLAIIDRGRVVAIDTPENLIAEVAGTARVRFRPPPSFDPGVLESLPAVGEVAREGRWVVVAGAPGSSTREAGREASTGGSALVSVVRDALDTHGISVTDLREDTPTLDDAFLALTASAPDTPHDREEVRR